MSIPFFSIIVPVYNAQDMISVCIESLLALNYPKDRYEILMVDNNSTDKTAEIIKKYPVTYLLEDKFQTSYASRNRGIANAKGDVLVFTDSDCVVDKDWLQEPSEIFADKTIGALGGKVLPYKPQTWIAKYQGRVFAHDNESNMSDDKIKNRNAVCTTANAFYRRDVFDAVGPFQQELYSGGDFEFALRVQKQTDYRFVFCKDAKIYHINCTTLRQLMRKTRRYGHHSILVQLLYDYDFEKDDAKHLAEETYRFGPYKVFFWRINLWKKVSTITSALFGYLFSFREEKKITLIDTYLNALKHGVFLYGELQSLMKNKEIIMKALEKKTVDLSKEDYKPYVKSKKKRN